MKSVKDMVNRINAKNAAAAKVPAVPVPAKVPAPVARPVPLAKVPAPVSPSPVVKFQAPAKVAAKVAAAALPANATQLTINWTKTQFKSDRSGISTGSLSAEFSASSQKEAIKDLKACIRLTNPGDGLSLQITGHIDGSGVNILFDNREALQKFTTDWDNLLSGVGAGPRIR